MKSTKREAGREVGGEPDRGLPSDAVLAVNPRCTFRWSARSAEADNRSRRGGEPSEDRSVGLSTLRVEERTLLALADGRRSVDDLAKLAGISSMAAVRHLKSMCDRGILVPADPSDATGLAASPEKGRSHGPTEMLEGRVSALSPPGGADATGPVEYDYSMPTDAKIERIPPETASGPSAASGGGSALAPPLPVPLTTLPTVIVGGDATIPTAASPVADSSPSPPVAAPSAGGRVAAQDAPAPASHPSSQPTKKSPSGPNVTLFWIPTSEQTGQGGTAESSSVTEAIPSNDSGPASGRRRVEGGIESGPTDGSRKTTEAKAIGSKGSGGATAGAAGAGTVVVIGSPAGASSSRVSAEQPTDAAAGSGKSGASAGPKGAAAAQGAPHDPSATPPPVGLPGGVSAIPATAAGGVSAPIPFRVGSYEVATRLAQGAMGSIYVCRRVGAAGFQRLFTLKVIRQHSTRKDIAVNSFLREARIGALVDHPNVQKLVDVGSYEEQPFLILDYIEGTNLADLLSDDRRIPVPILLSIILDVLRGLQHVHDVVDEQGARSGLVHGDVSPQNILIGVDGVARLTDFGSARFAMEMETEAAETAPVAVGKPAYMAPEQLRGELGDARTDLFSVGVVLWTALTGQKLFSAETYDQTAMRVMRRKIPAPSEHGAPTSLDAILLKALSRAPEGRYSSADEMARDLLKVAGTENLVASPREVGQWVRRELGDTLVEHRRKIQEIFGGLGSQPGQSGQGKTPDPQLRRPPRAHKTTPKTADGYERLPAKTIQISAISPRRYPVPSAPSPSWEPPSKPPTRSQWYVVILSAVVAGCALIVAIIYLVTSLAAPPKKSGEKAGAGAALAPQSGASSGAPSTAPAPVAGPESQSARTGASQQ